MAKITVTGTQIKEALNALHFITGITDDTKKARFTFKPKAKVILAKRLKMLQNEDTELDVHRKATLERLGIQGITDKDGKALEDPALLAAFQKEWSQFLAVEQELDIGLIDEALLELGTEEAPKNDIAAGFLAALEWLIAWTDKDPAPAAAEPAKA